MGMGAAVAAIVLAIIGIWMIVISRHSLVTYKDGVVGKSQARAQALSVLRPTGIVVLVIAIGLFVGSFVTVIPAGHRGVVTWFGKVEERVLGEGIAIVVPLAEQITQVDVRVQPHPFKKVDGASQEYQSVGLTGMLNYRLDPAKVNRLYQTVGLDFTDKIIDPALNDIVKEVLPRYSIIDILPKRDQIRAETKERLQVILGKYDIEVIDIYISNIEFSADYSKAIETKQLAEQQVATERNILLQKEIKAQQAVAEAKGLADSDVVRAEGTARANREIAASLTPEVLQSQYINKLADDISVILVPSGQQFLLDTKGLLTKSP